MFVFGVQWGHGWIGDDRGELCHELRVVVVGLRKTTGQWTGETRQGSMSNFFDLMGH